MLRDDELQEIQNRHEGAISYGAYVDWEPKEEHDPGKKMVSASIIKSYLLYYVLKNRGEFREQIPVSEFILTEDTVLKYFSGNTINLDAALSLMICVSDNTAANYFLDSIGMGRMNEFLHDEHFTQTSFGRRFLDFDAKREGRENYTSVTDIVSLFQGILQRRTLNVESAELFDSLLKLQFDRAKLAFYYPESVVTGSKTGVLDNVWNDVIYFNVNGSIALVAFFTEGVPGVNARDLLASYGLKVARKYFPNLF